MKVIRYVITNPDIFPNSEAFFNARTNDYTVELGEAHLYSTQDEANQDVTENDIVKPVEITIELLDTVLGVFPITDSENPLSPNLNE